MESDDPLDARLSAVSGKRVLYIEDNELNRILVMRILEPFRGIELRCAESGEAGLAMVEQFEPDVLMLDLHLPGIGGQDVLKAVRGKHAMPIVVFSADAVPEWISSLMADGATDYLTKPLDLAHFMQRLADLLKA